MQESDEQLIDWLVSGNITALDALYGRYARPVYSLAIRILGDNADAEEVTQDVFERVWRHAQSFDKERGKVGTWVLSMTHHVSIDLLRKRQRRPQSIDSEAAEQVTLMIPDGQQPVDEQTLRSLEAVQIRRALRSLPESQRQAIELAYFGGLSHLEIAAVLGDPLGTVKTRIRRGMERLRSALEGVGIGGEGERDTR